MIYTIFPFPTLKFFLNVGYKRSTFSKIWGTKHTLFITDSLRVSESQFFSILSSTFTVLVLFKRVTQHPYLCFQFLIYDRNLWVIGCFALDFFLKWSWCKNMEYASLLKWLKNVSFEKNGGGKKFPVSRSYRDSS